MRLIDADELKKHWDITMYDDPYGCSFQAIDKQPTVDIVRCEECKEFSWYDKYLGWCNEHHHCVTSDCYCNFGERGDNK